MQHIRNKLEQTSNFIINYKKEHFAPDYASFLKNKFQSSLTKLIAGLILSIILFISIRAFYDWRIIESVSAGLIILISTFVLFKIFEILTIKKKLEKSISQVSFGKTNLIIEPTFIELNQYGRKK